MSLKERLLVGTVRRVVRLRFAIASRYRRRFGDYPDDPERPGSERVKIYVEPEPGADLDAADVREHLEGRVPRQAMPSEVVFVEAIPLTDVGKIDKQSLREREGAAA